VITVAPSVGTGTFDYDRTEHAQRVQRG
jgi:hypothetical protein